MASLAPSGGPIGAQLLHPLLELALVRVSVATGAVKILPVVHHGLRFELRIGISRFLVAIGARHRNVAAGQNEARLFVEHESEGGWAVAIQSVATLAGVEVRRGGELSSVAVAVAIGAMLKLDLKLCVFALGKMALIAAHSGMSALQRISAGRVVLHGKRRRLPSVDSVARGALALIGARGELAFVRVGLVAICALCKHQRLLEVAARVALGTLNARMLSFQRKLRLGMVKALIHSGDRNFLPA